MGLGEKLSNILPTRVADMMRRRPKAPLDDDDAESSETLANRMGLIAPDGKRKVKWDWFVLVLVFYTGRSYARLTTFYEQIIGMDNSCMNWAAMVHNNLPGDADVKWNCIRLMLACMREQSTHLSRTPVACARTPPRAHPHAHARQRV